MQRNPMPSGTERDAQWEPRQIVAILGIVGTGVALALILPVWMAAILLLCCLCALRVIAVTATTVLEPVVIRRDERQF